MFRFTMVCLALIVITAAPAIAAPAPAAVQIPKTLLQKRRDAARKVFEYELRRFHASANVSVTELAEWSSRWLEGEVAVNDKKAGPISACKAHLERMREIEQAAIRQVETGEQRPSIAEAATYYRLEAEIRLLKAGGTLDAPEEKKETGQRK